MIDDDFDPDWKAERDRADEEFLNESPERRQKREERDQLLVKAAELTMESLPSSTEHKPSLSW
jgi:hypothetical protein